MLAKPNRFDAGTEAQALSEAAVLGALCWKLRPVEIIARATIERFVGKIATVFFLGADSAVLLHMIAEIDRKLLVIFLDTGKYFGEMLDYRDVLAADFRLIDIRFITPDVIITLE